MDGKRILSIVLTLTLLLGAVASAGLFSSSAGVDEGWTAGDGDVGQYRTFGRWDNDALQQIHTALTAAGATNLVQGMTPEWGYKGNVNSGQTWANYVKSGSVTTVTDGVIRTDANDGATEFNGTAGAMRYFIFDLGETKQLTDFIVAGTQPDGTAQCLSHVKIYVAEDRADLEADDSLVYSRWNQTVDSEQRHFHIRPTAGTVQGRYVAFSIGIGAQFYGGIRLSELAVYGKADEGWTAGDGDVGQYRTFGRWDNDALQQIHTTLTAAGATNLVQGMTPEWGYKGNVNSGQTWANYVKSGSVTTVTDGVIRTDANDGATEFNGTAGAMRYFIFDLGETKQLTDFIVAGTQPDGTAQCLSHVKIYVAEDRADLEADDSLVYSRWNQTVDSEQRHFHIRPTAGTVQGRYVAFSIGIGAQFYGGIRLSELAVYGKDDLSWSDGDTLDTENNRVSTAVVDTVRSSNANSKWSTALPALCDGVATNTAGLYLYQPESGYPEAENPVTGEAIRGTSGWSQITLELAEYVSVERILLLGSPKDSATASWSYASEDTAKNYWGDRYTLKDGRYYAAYTAGGEIRTFDNRHLLYYEVYVSDTLGGLYKEKNRVLQFDNTETLYVGATHTLETPKAGSYVGVRVTGGTNSLARIGELGIYGTTATPPDTGVTSWKEGDALDAENNRLTKAQYVTTNTAGEQISSNRLLATTPAALYDGDAANKGTFYTYQPEEGYPDAENPVTGEAIVGTSGWAQFAFALDGYVSIDRVLVIGSSGDAVQAGWTWATEAAARNAVGAGNYTYNPADGRYYAANPDGSIHWFNNRNLLYYEVYVSDHLDDLYAADHRVLTFDNSETLYVGAYHRLQAIGAYIGFRITCGGQNMCRIGELAVYGTSVEKNVTVSAETAIGTVAVTVESAGSADREVLEELLGGVRVTAESLPASVPQYLDSGWLTVENRTVWRVELLDKQGRVLAKDGDPATTLAGRAVQVRFPSTGNYMQMMGLYRDGQITRLVNSYKDASGQVRAGTLNYPEYTGVTNQRDKAVLSDTDLRFVYLRFSQADRIRQLRPSVAEFSAGLGQ